jgi:hypothetical protein
VLRHFDVPPDDHEIAFGVFEPGNPRQTAPPFEPRLFE